NPKFIGSQPTGGVAWDDAFGGKNLYVANDQGLVIVQNVAAPPRIDATRITIAASSTTTAQIGGAAGAVVGDFPIRIDVVNVSTAGTISLTLPVDSDGSFSATLPASAGAPMTITATDAHGRVAGPVIIGSVPFASSSATTPIVISDASYHARTIAVDGTTVAVAGYPNPSGSDKLAVFDVTNPSAPLLRRSNSAAQGAIRDVVIQNGWAYIAADHFSTLNLSDPLASFVNTSESCGGRNAVVVSGGYAFVADTGCNLNGGIWVYDVTNPAAPRFLGTQAVAGIGGHDFTDLQLLGNDYIVALSNSATGRDVMVIDRRDVNALKKAGELTIASIAAFRGKIAGNLLYIAGGDGGVAIVDVSVPSAPRLVSSFDTPGIARGVDIAGATLAVSDGSDGVSFYEVSDPANPKFIGSQPTGGVAWDDAFGGKNLYVANDQGLVIVQNVAAPPRIDASRIALAYDGSASTAITGVAGAISGSSPVNVTIRDAATSASVSVSANNDGSFTAALASTSGDALTATATDSAGRTAGPVSIGTIPFGTSPNTTAIVIAGDSNYRARTVAAEGPTLVVAGYPAPSGSDKLAVFDVTNPSAPLLRRSNSAAQGAIRDVVVQNGWAYIAADHFSTLNLTDPAATFVNTSESCGSRNAVVVSAGYAFVADANCNQNGAIYVYDVSNPAAPKFQSSQPVAGVSGHDFTDLELLGSDYLVALSNSATGRDVMVIDRRDVNALKKVGELSIASLAAFRGKVVGGRLYVAGADGGAAIVDLSVPASPQLLWSGGTPGIARGIDVVGTTFAVADGDEVAFYDASVPTAPRFLGAQPAGGTAWDLAFDGTSLFIANDLGLATIERVYAPPQITPSLITIGTDGAIAGSTLSVTPSTSLTLNDVNGTASASTIASTGGAFTATLAAPPGHVVSMIATDGSNRSATRVVGA
ncbi:MAG TPA: hypothetical protein VL284_09060, partial [Thermoanaerobaculia bacterium]|nr:hypothetical protein [Thermoanaerobaculia bacterium]